VSNEAEVQKQFSGPVRITITDPETGDVLEETVLTNSYMLIWAGDYHLVRSERDPSGYTLTIGLRGKPPQP